MNIFDRLEALEKIPKFLELMAKICGFLETKWHWSMFASYIGSLVATIICFAAPALIIGIIITKVINWVKDL